MISFEREGFCFNYRLAGVAVRPFDGYILLQRTDRDPQWCLPGGRCEMDEASTVGLIREIHEEIGAPARIGPLLYVVENFYTCEQTRFHELGLYFAMDFPDASWVYEQQGDFPGYEPDLPLIYRWVRRP